MMRESVEMTAIVRSRACSLVGQPVEALKSLDIAERYSVKGADDPETAELRALAFELSLIHI